MKRTDERELRDELNKDLMKACKVIICIVLTLGMITLIGIYRNGYDIECIGNVSYIVMRNGSNIAPVLQVDKNGNPVACSIQ